MHVTEKKISIDSNWFSPERDVARSPGLHLSGVIDYIEAQTMLRKQNRGPLDDDAHARMVAGFMWERLLERLIEGDPNDLWDWMFGRVLAEPANPRVIRPGEQCLDGIYMTPDGYHIDDKCLEEWKYTSKSSRNPITSEKFSRWLDYQIPSYLKVLGLNVCRLRVYFARGDYTTGQPEWREYMLHYTQQELDETWAMIVQNAKEMQGYLR